MDSDIEYFLEKDPHIGNALDFLVNTGDVANQQLALNMLKSNYSDEIIEYVLFRLWMGLNDEMDTQINDRHHVMSYFFNDDGTPKSDLNNWNMRRTLNFSFYQKMTQSNDICYTSKRYANLADCVIVSEGCNLFSDHIKHFKDITSLKLFGEFDDSYYEFQKLKNISISCLLSKSVKIDGKSFPHVKNIYVKGFINLKGLVSKKDVFSYLPNAPDLRYLNIKSLDSQSEYFGHFMENYPKLRRIDIEHLFDGEYFDFEAFRGLDHSFQLTIKSGSISKINPPKWFLDKHMFVLNNKWITND